MAPNLLNYYQEVLEKISTADAATFRKELRKAFKRTTAEERAQLKTWFRSACLCRIGSSGSAQRAGGPVS
jgi:hypothetical protein